MRLPGLGPVDFKLNLHTQLPVPTSVRAMFKGRFHAPISVGMVSWPSGPKQKRALRNVQGNSFEFHRAHVELFARCGMGQVPMDGFYQPEIRSLLGNLRAQSLENHPGFTGELIRSATRWSTSDVFFRSSMTSSLDTFVASNKRTPSHWWKAG